jgi:1-acyl-sn-glycerol-3-phosphate acyltransferase
VSPWARRAITIPGYFVLFAAALALLPVAVPLAALSDLARDSRFAAARAMLFFVWYLGCEVLGLSAAFALWLAQQALRPTHAQWLAWNFRLKCWWGRQLVRGARLCFSLRFQVDGRDALGRGPHLVFMRHASTADTILTTALLSDPLGLDYRHVMKRELLWDPCIDVAGNRLPNYFVDRDSTDSAREIACVRRLAEDLTAGHGVLIYPEGTRFTPEKRARILDKLASGGHAELLARAHALRHVLPPRLGGPIALLDYAPPCDVVFCAHVGFDGIQSFREFLSGNLVGRLVHLSYWVVPARDVPADRDARIDWLFEHWRRVDEWVGAHKKA